MHKLHVFVSADSDEIHLNELKELAEIFAAIDGYLCKLRVAR